jgi:pyrrolidone-carboxylate peptidase
MIAVCPLPTFVIFMQKYNIPFEVSNKTTTFATNYTVYGTAQ